MKLINIIAPLLILLFNGQIVKSHHQNIPIACNDDEQCRSFHNSFVNAVCRGELCQCYEGGVMKICSVPHKMLVSTKALVPIGRECKLQNDCKVENSICNTTMSQCLCKHGFVSNINGNKCLPVVSLIGGRCEDNKQCLANLTNTTCLQYQCVCIDGFHHVNGICYKNKGIGEPCKNTEECSHNAHVECNKNNTCGCSADSVLSADSERCLPLARQLSEQCNESSQCRETLGDHAECVDSTCKCSLSSHYASGISKCVLTKRINEACDRDENCYQSEFSESITLMKCLNNVCTCVDGYIHDGNKCVLSAASTTITKTSVGLVILLLLLIFLPWF